MSTRVESPGWIPSWGTWAILAAVVGTGLLLNWAVAAGLLVLLMVQVARPLDFLVAFLLVTGGAAFVYYQGGRLTFELSLLTAAIVMMLICYVVSHRDRLFTIPLTTFTIPLLVYLTLTFLNLLRGVILGYPLKSVGIELLPVLAMGCAFLVGNAFQARRDMKLALGGMLLGAFGSAALGFYSFAVLHTRTGGVYYTPFPGIVGFFLFNLALRAKNPVVSLIWVVISLPLFLHQFLSFRRGLWVGCIVEILVLISLFGVGSGARLRRGVLLLGTLVGLAGGGAVAMAVLYGQTDILESAGERFASIGGVKKVEVEGPVDPSSLSNIERLIEYGIVAKHIMGSPIFGYGLGFTFLGTKPYPRVTRPQWWVHQSYLYTALKQGALGLGIFIWVLISGFLLAAREARRRTDPWEASWMAATAGATAYLAAFAMFDFVFVEVNVTFLIALLWGGAMAMSRHGSLDLRWRTAPKET